MTPSEMTAADITDALAASGGNVASAARALGVSRAALTVRIDKLGLSTLKSSARAKRTRVDDRDILDPVRIAENQTQAELAHLRRENTGYAKALAAREEVAARIIEAARVPVEVPDYTVAAPRDDLPVRSAVLPIYDLQYGQLVNPADVPHGQGAYDSETLFDQRAERYLQAVTGSMRDYAASHYVEELVLALGGDLVEGADIFGGQPWQLDKDPARQTVDLAHRLAVLLRRLIAFAKEELGVRRIMLLAVPGNHGKVGGKKSGATPTTMSWDWLVVEFLRLHLRHEPIDVWGSEPAGSLLFETANHLFLMVHGDEIKGHSGIPFYGLSKFDGKAIRLAGAIFDYCLLGHHHQQSAIPNGSGGEFLMSGDWVGGNNLSKVLHSNTRPQQRLLFVSKKYGVTEPIPIYLTDKKTLPRPRVYSTDGVAACSTA